MIVRWPSVVNPGTVITQTASSLDVFPTILAIAGIEIDEPRQGRSLLPLLQGESPGDWDQDLYAEYHMINYAEADMRCYRTPQFKLIRDKSNEGRDEFYDLVNDPGETQNLINDRSPQVRRAIEALLLKLDRQVSSLDTAMKRPAP